MFFLSDMAVIIFGLNAVVLSTILSFGYARHLPYKLSFGRLNGVLNCPHYHQLHHSTNPAHFDKNFGHNLIIWDRLFGTVAIPKPDEDFVYGLPNNESKDYHSVARLYSVPLVKLAIMAQRKLLNLHPAKELSRPICTLTFNAWHVAADEGEDAHIHSIATSMPSTRQPDAPLDHTVTKIPA